VKILASFLALAIVALAAQDTAVPPAPTITEQHRWLQQLVGEWSCTMETFMDPDAEPERFESQEQVRSLGDVWILAEGEADFGGMSFRSILTLGYDPKQKAFVGTWIDTLQTHLWTYTGQLDAARKVLTLEAKGPAHDDPEKVQEYRDAIEILGPDHRRLTSSALGEDGKWTTFMKADYHRRK
jgi:hypothetical protein